MILNQGKTEQELLELAKNSAYMRFGLGMLEGYVPLRNTHASSMETM